MWPRPSGWWRPPVGSAGRSPSTWKGRLRRIADLAELPHRFVVAMLVMTDDEAVGGNRPALLCEIGLALSLVAVLSEMVVDREEQRKRRLEAIEEDFNG